MAKKVGRPESDNPRTFDLPNIRLNREEKRVTLLKACLHNGGNVSAYIRELIINDHREPKPLVSCSCGSHSLHITHTDEERIINLGEEERTIRLTDVPRSKCSECGRVLGDLRLSAQIESFLDEEILWRLNNQQEIPEIMAFDDLLSIIC